MAFSSYSITYIHLPFIYFCQLAAVLHDKMTQCRYEEPLESFDLGVSPAPWFEVDVVNKGRPALEEVNTKLGQSGLKTYFAQGYLFYEVF